MAWLALDPDKQIDEMVYFIWDTYDVMVSESAVKRTLKRAR